MKTTKAHTPALKRIRVLVIDDHALIRRGIVATLSEESDIAVVDATGTANAINAMKAHKPDVALVDMTLRGATGLELIKEIAYDPRTKVLALDIHAEPTVATRVIKAGAKGYLTHETDTKLADGIRRVHAGKLAVSDEIAQQMVATLAQAPTHAAAGDPIEALTDRELELAELMGRGMTASKIAEAMGISIKTVETHKMHMKTKLGVSNGAQLVRYCVQWYESRKHRS